LLASSGKFFARSPHHACAPVWKEMDRNPRSKKTSRS
jgi:hypothetical protein